MSQPRSRPIAAITALLAVLSFVTAVLYVETIPENPPGDGFAAGLTGLFVLLCVVVGVLALAEAGLLFLVDRVREPTERSRQLLTTGAVVGSLSVVVLIVPMLIAHVFDVFVPGYGLGIGLLLVPIGILCSGVGALAQLVDEVRAKSGS
ncbi:hypothetical protein ACERIM_00160 [Natrinema sp. H-ect1]|uniref:hypothetical protein n=1 Tax=Natrinema sp. H-ect1 TaxID=3242700 RepID=UPI00359EDF45